MLLPPTSSQICHLGLSLRIPRGQGLPLGLWHMVAGTAPCFVSPYVSTVAVAVATPDSNIPISYLAVRCDVRRGFLPHVEERCAKAEADDERDDDEWERAETPTNQQSLFLERRAKGKRSTETTYATIRAARPTIAFAHRSRMRANPPRSPPSAEANQQHKVSVGWVRRLELPHAHS
ncbi:uncharacterized protein BKA78DRAFT_312199 [Phyllosticta capitalensis]|uniref:uncharacterized protein n=1 Tax=Phyllosticta capitalensis TaxID=121624 RepID=UPI0031326238